MTRHPIGRAVAAAVAVAVVVLLAASPASAHVLLAKAQPNGDGSTTLTFTFDHGCGESPTTELVVSLPAGATEPTGAGQPAGWTAAVEAAKIGWSGPGLGDGGESAFSFTTRLTGAVGQTLRFPTEQRCANGESYSWSDPQASDEHPAPSLIATQAVLAATTATTAAAPNTRAATMPQALGAFAVFVAVVAVSAVLATRRSQTDDGGD